MCYKRRNKIGSLVHSCGSLWVNSRPQAQSPREAVATWIEILAKSSSCKEVKATWSLLQQLPPQVSKAGVEVEANRVPGQHRQGEAHQLQSAHVRVLDQKKEGNAVKDESSPEDVGEEVDEAGNLLEGANAAENGRQASQAVDAKDPSRSQLDVRSNVCSRHLLQVAHLHH